MPEEQAFAVLIKIMYQYHHRDVFKANFHQLHLMFFQLDRLLKVFCNPDTLGHYDLVAFGPAKVPLCIGHLPPP